MAVLRDYKITPGSSTIAEYKQPSDALLQIVHGSNQPIQMKLLHLPRAYKVIENPSFSKTKNMSFADSTTRESIEAKFNRLAKEWREETEFVSAANKIILNAAYQQIIGMGPSALPFIFSDLEMQADHWSWALVAIIGEDPIRPEDYGDLQKMRDTWLRWATEKGFLVLEPK